MGAMSMTQAVEETPARKARTSNLAVSALKGIGNRLGLRTPSSARPPTSAPAPSSRPAVEAPPVAPQPSTADTSTPPMTGDDPGLTSTAVHAPEATSPETGPPEETRKTLGYAMRDDSPTSR